jgi:N-dimethylarginine dimethylaminohydrolase
MVEPLRRVLVKRPGESFGSADPELWHYTAQPDLEAARSEHDALTETLRRAGVEVIYQGDDGAESADSLFTHDPSLVSDAGAILLNMGKPLRRDEPKAVERLYTRLGIPILHRLRGEASAEGGDLMWLDHHTLAVGLGARTNAAGFDELDRALSPLGVTLLPVPLPEPEDVDDCLHLMSLISLVAADLAVAYVPLLPTSLCASLDARGIEVIEVPQDELPTMGPNVLAVAPRRCLMLEGNPITRRRLERAGCRVETYRGEEISLKAEGGATCLTRPILRRAT